jgi:hypothetical protein
MNKQTNKKTISRKKKSTNPKISRGFAITIIVIISVTLGAMLWLNARQIRVVYDTQQNVVAGKKDKAKDVAENNPTDSCPHYYDGEVQIEGWSVGDNGDGGDVVMQVAPADLEKLPTNGVVANDAKNNFKVKLVDASADVKQNLQKSDSKNPAVVTIKGYASVCGSAVPLVSLEPATVAFKKS